ncbi:protein KRI1 homolog [Toxorhynchites rutilus septentrionalis]|uniref:protein KRI1 homolog n=1 Tax=Toxorhynchites rutilus septentrionalis TaxID=329112 RepID=UPI00247A3F8E|nr:protein KRI1 homolog [Toxorhynchites rutilus septentrionalis]
MGKIQLFNESDQEEEEELKFKTNRGYAKHYDEFRKKEILGQLKNLGSESESSSSDDETTDEEVMDPEFDKEFFRTLAFLKRRDATKYEEKPTFFENVKPVEEVALAKRKKKEKPLTLKDYERKVMLEKGGVFEDEDDDPRREVRAESPSLVKQQEQIKDEIKRALSKIDTDDEEEDDSKGGLLKERSKSKAETDKEKADYLAWLADKKQKGAPSEDAKPLEPLKDFWSSKTLSKEDAFLKDYILNKRFVDNAGDIPTYEDIVATSEDEEELERQETYERQYNFRFEEPDAEFIKRYPRNVEESVRIERNKRKEQRQALKERKQQEKEQKKRELEELKAIKLQEIREKIQKLKEIAATENIAMKEEDLESDFDPDEHDRRMRQMFDDDYYEVDEGDQKPDFPELDEELGIENYDREKSKIDELQDYGPYCEDDDFIMDADYEENSKKIKNDLQEELLEATGARKKKKGKRMSKFTEMLRKERPLFDPEDEKTYGEYIDEYYKLDYEDIIGDMPCRFRYTETVPNDFGLSIEEILSANTRELNRWASVKKTVQIRPKYVELGEIESYKRKAHNETLKRKILPSLFIRQEDSDEDEDEDIKEQKQKQNTVTKFEEEVKPETSEVQVEKKKKKKKKKHVAGEAISEEVASTSMQDETNSGAVHGSAKDCIEQKIHKSEKKRKKAKHQQESAETPMSENKTHSEVSQPSKKRKRLDVESTQFGDANTSQANPKRKKFDQQNKKHRKNKQNGEPFSNVTDDRLRAFGINPRKFHNKLKYGNKDKQGNDGQKGDHHKQNQREKFKKKNWNKK